MSARFSQRLLVVALGAFAMGASAENTTPRDNPEVPAASGPVENGSPVGDTTLPSTAGDFKTSPSPGIVAPATKYPPSGTDSSGYARGWTQVDPKCQTLSGAALDACLKGADHGQ